MFEAAYLSAITGALGGLYGQSRRGTYPQTPEEVARLQQIDAANQAVWNAQRQKLDAQLKFYEDRRKAEIKQKFDSRKEEVMDRRMSRRREQIWKRNWMWAWQGFFWLTVPVVAAAGIAAIYRACAWIIFT